ncbi:MAG: hypothetical protein ABI950_08355, partial [Solirubrobacteraceae bacterium]
MHGPGGPGQWAERTHLRSFSERKLGCFWAERPIVRVERSGIVKPATTVKAVQDGQYFWRVRA